MQTNQSSLIQSNFFEAIKINDIKAVEDLLKKGASLYVYNEENLTPLMVAAKHGHQEVIKLLVSKGASLYQRSGRINEEHWGNCLTAEGVAHVFNQLKAEEMLSTFAYRYQKQYRNCIYALKSEDWDSLRNRIFDDYWYDVNAQGGENGRTILMQAAKSSSFSMVKNLIENGVDVNRRDGLLKTALHYACGNDGAFVDVPDMPRKDWKKHYRANNCYHVVKTLVEAGADVNAHNVCGETPLLYSLETGKKDIALYLIKNGSDVNLKYDNGSSPLGIAAANGYVDIAEKLLEKGAVLDEPGFENKTPLQLAFSCQQRKMVRFLIEKGADVNIPFEDGRTLAWFAVEMRDGEMLDWLLQAGADITKEDKYGRSALYWAGIRNNDCVLEVIRRHQAQPQKVGQNQVLPNLNSSLNDHING